MADPMERLIHDALVDADLDFSTDYGGGNPSRLDFRLSNGVEIEVKRFYSPRIADQMDRADNVIVAQGEQAVKLLAAWIRGER